VAISTTVGRALMSDTFAMIGGHLAAAVFSQLREARAATPPAVAPFEGTRWFHAQQTGVTYAEMLTTHLAGERDITIVDPHIKAPHQIENLGELLDILAAAAHGVRVRLVTARASGGFAREWRQANLLWQLKDAVATRGVELTVEFDESNHDRWISTPRWTIVLGKGLDVWDGSIDRTVPQRERAVRQTFTVTYTRAS